jgi:hypothetical protein
MLTSNPHSWKSLHTLTRRAQLNSTNIRKLEACIHLYGGLVEVYPPALKSLGAMLGHRYPRVRSVAVEEMWIRLDGMGARDKEGINEKEGKEGMKSFDWVGAKKDAVASRWEGVLKGVEVKG